MKKIILSFLSKYGYKILKENYLKNLLQESQNNSSARKELYELAKRTILPSLPENPSPGLLESYNNLIGTSPIEGLYILESLNKTSMIEGEICEFGIAQGATSQFMASFIMFSQTSKKLVLLDSFQGLSAPTDEDKLKDDIFGLGDMKSYYGTMSYGKNHVIERLKKIGFPLSQVRILEGYAEEVINRNELPQKISFAYIDFDLFEPIFTILKNISNRISKGGIIIVDDYDFFSTGAKKAVDDFIASESEKFSIEIPTSKYGHFAKITRQ